MRKPLVKGDVTVEQFDELLAGNDLLREEREVAIRLKALVSEISPARAQTRELNQEQERVAQEIKAGELSRTERENRKRLEGRIGAEVAGIEKSIKEKLATIEKELRLLRRLERLRRQTSYRSPEGLTNSGRIFLVEKNLPLSKMQKLGLAAGTLGILAYPAGMVAFGLAGIWQGMIIFGIQYGILGLMGFSAILGVSACKATSTYRGTIPLENYRGYIKARETELFDHFVLIENTSGPRRVLCGVMGNIPHLKDLKASDIKGYCFEVTTWSERRRLE